MKARIIIGIAIVAAGCGGSTREPGAPSKPDVEAAAPAPTGRIITIEMHTDEKGSYFLPSEVEARPGDVLRYTLVAGVHNAHFVPDSNPGIAQLPGAGEMLQLPGQTTDVVVAMPTGKHFFQCDPHAALGMTGKLEVEDD